MLMIGGYSAHTWELEAQRAWTPAFLIACVLALGATKDTAVQFGATFYLGDVHHGGLLHCYRRLPCRTAGAGRPSIIAMMSISIACSFTFGWLIGGSMFLVMAVGLCYGFSVIAESPVFSSALTEVVSPDYLGTAYGLRSLIGFGAGAISPTVFGLILDVTNTGQTNADRIHPELGVGVQHAGFRRPHRALDDVQTPRHAREPEDGGREKITTPAPTGEQPGINVRRFPLTCRSLVSIFVSRDTVSPE